MGQEAVPWRRRLCRGRVLYCGARGCAVGQGAVPWGRLLHHPMTSPAHSPGLAKAVEGTAEAEPGGSLRGVRALLLPPEVLLGWARPCQSEGAAAAAGAPRPPHPCARSCPEHPISQLLRRLQCAVYARLYPAVSRGPADASPGSPSALSFLSLDAGGSSLPAEPGGRRLRASRSLHCMFSVPEHGPATLRHSQSSTPLADSSAPGPAEPPEPPRESSFEDLERFLASPEGWAAAESPASSGQDTALPELLKGVVRDIHNAIGEGQPREWGAQGGPDGGPSVGWGSERAPCLALPRQAAGSDSAGLRGTWHRRRQGPVPGLPGGGFLSPAVGPAPGPLQVPRPLFGGGLRSTDPFLASPVTSVPAGPCSSPARPPWRAAWSGTGTPAPPTWGWPRASSRPAPAAPRTPRPCRTCG